MSHFEMGDPEVTFRDHRVAFDEAIAAGRLSDDPAMLNYAGNYMYMRTIDGKDRFKHIQTREYLP